MEIGKGNREKIEKRMKERDREICIKERTYRKRQQEKERQTDFFASKKN